MNILMAAFVIVSVVALFAICVAVKKTWDADFYNIMWKDLKRQNDNLFNRVKELQDRLNGIVKEGARPVKYSVGDRIYSVMDVGGAMTRGEPVLMLEAMNDE